MVGRESLVARDPLGVIWESLFAGRSVVGRTEVIGRAKPVKCWKGVIGRGRSVRGWPKITVAVVRLKVGRVSMVAKYP